MNSIYEFMNGRICVAVTGSTRLRPRGVKSNLKVKKKKKRATNHKTRAKAAIYSECRALPGLIRRYAVTLVWIWALCCGEEIAVSASERRRHQGQEQEKSATASSNPATSSSDLRYIDHPEGPSDLTVTLPVTLLDQSSPL